MAKGLPKRSENYSEWYNEIVKRADLAENSAVRGCMVIKPYGFALWENMRDQLDRMFKEYKAGEAPENMVKLSGWLRDADGFVIVTGEYNHGLQPGLKNFLDHFQKEYYFKPSGIVSYSGGRFGGQIAAMNMRLTMAELGSVTIPVINSIPKVQDAFDEDGNPQEEYIDKATKKFLDEYEWYLEALKLQRDKGNPY